MNEVWLFIKKIFIKDHQELSRQELIVALGLLWFLNLFSLMPFSTTLLGTIIQSQHGVLFISASSIFTRISMFLLGVGMPWTFFLLIGSITLTFRLFGKVMNPIVNIISGLSLFGFFRSLFMLPLLFTGYAESFTSETTMLALLEPNLQVLKWLLMYCFASGILFICTGFFRLKPVLDNVVNENPKELNRESFIQFSAYLSLVAILLSTLLSLVVVFFLGGDFEDPIFLGIQGLLMIGIGILNLLMTIRRLRNTKLSLFFLLIYLIPLLFMAAGLFIQLQMENIFLRDIGNLLLRIAVDLPGLMFLCLAFIPSIMSPSVNIESK